MLQVAIAQFAGATVLHVPPLAAGLLASTIRRAAVAAEVRVHVRRQPVEVAAAALANADVVGLSLYTWHARYALEVARRAKLLRKDLVIVAGGPSVPRRDATAFLDAHPWLDALVLGEGELAFLDIIERAQRGADFTAIAGVVTRTAATISVGPPRPRLATFDAIGSPYLDGTFDELRARDEIPAMAAVVLETNRGCPFACTFCDWGQATQSRVNELPLERIERELAWIGERKISYLYLVDANFGIRPRDVEITKAIGRIANTHDAPRFVFFHLTKNATQKNLRTVEILREHGVRTQVALSMQDFDADVLTAIRRDNIKPEHALALREHCHALGLSTVNELMLGLPAQTAASIRRSLVAALTPSASDSFFVYPTRVLENAEMADPAYRARFAIETRQVPSWPADPADEMHVVEREELIVATSSLPVEDWRRAYAFGHLLSAAWNQRLLQTTVHLLAFVLEADVAQLVDGLLDAHAQLRGELDRYTQAILDETATVLAIEGWGNRRYEPADAVCACAFADPDRFYASAAAVATRIAGPLAAEAVAWDALRFSTRARTLRFEHDWLGYEAAMADRPRPAARPMIVSVTPAPAQAAGNFALEARKHARASVTRIGEPFVPTTRDTLGARAREDGFAYLPRALSAATLAPLRTLVDQELVQRGWLVDGHSDPALRLGRWDDARWHAFLATIMASHEYKELATHPELLALLRAVLDAEPTPCAGDVCRLVSPNALDLTTPPHQDAAYLTPTLWTAWLPLRACPLELGPLAVLPGSHRDGVRPHAPLGSDGVIGITTSLDDARWQTSDLEEGDVILFSALTVHRALPNVTANRLRVSVDFRYEPTARSPRS
ncbi:MAG TPA: phytanoyl-CoA dioxygenase family protein [Kofleriaceae bacterium]|nr:phytanoyl-CoA dioxygenase family protein [Kofleriaceae bacterium]